MHIFWFKGTTCRFLVFGVNTTIFDLIRNCVLSGYLVSIFKVFCANKHLKGMCEDTIIQFFEAYCIFQTFFIVWQSLQLILQFYSDRSCHTTLKDWTQMQPKGKPAGQLRSYEKLSKLNKRLANHGLKWWLQLEKWKLEHWLQCDLETMKLHLPLRKSPRPWI